MTYPSLPAVRDSSQRRSAISFEAKGTRGCNRTQIACQYLPGMRIHSGEQQCSWCTRGGRASQDPHQDGEGCAPPGLGRSRSTRYRCGMARTKALAAHQFAHHVARLLHRGAWASVPNFVSRAATRGWQSGRLSQRTFALTPHSPDEPLSCCRPWPIQI